MPGFGFPEHRIKEFSPARQAVARLANWVLPPEIFRALAYWDFRNLKLARRERQTLAGNAALKGCNGGRRLFILANGPSVKAQDLSALVGEDVMTVSSGYLHPLFSKFAPRYHAIPQLTFLYHSESHHIDWLREMHEYLDDAELFMSITDKQRVEENGLFPGRKIHYVCFGRRFFPRRNAIPDITGVLPGVQSVPVMTLMLALYMGYEEIYLLGVDHDWFVTKEYGYFFQPSATSPGHTAGNLTITNTLLDDIWRIERLWYQYRRLREIAECHGVRIFNATHGGMLDEYPRLRFESIAGLGKASPGQVNNSASAP